MRKKIIICLILIIAILIIFFITRKNVESGSEEQIPSLPIDYSEKNNENDEKNKEEVIKILEDQGLQANENIYELAQEYDGREVVVVKSSIKYKVALAGSIKRQKPEFSEINNILENAPKHTGIWVPESSREKFLDIIKDITKAIYSINEDGFLTQKETWMMNSYDQSISKMLNDEKLHIFDISSLTYLVDEVTGEIQEYPFEEMDPYTEYEYFSDDDKEIFIISEGKEGKVNSKDCLVKIFE